VDALAHGEQELPVDFVDKPAEHELTGPLSFSYPCAGSAGEPTVPAADGGVSRQA
jgi:hypothetical protein